MMVISRRYSASVIIKYFPSNVRVIVINIYDGTVQIWTSFKEGDYAQANIVQQYRRTRDSCTRDRRADLAAHLEGSPDGWR
jgi:hypothetical protein